MIASENKNIDLSILRKSPKLSKHAILEIIPLAPLSMVSDMPGAYYKTLMYPSKKMICGLFENMLEWHFSQDIRSKILKDMELERKLQGNKHIQSQYNNGSTYIPLLIDYFSIKKPKLTPLAKDFPICFYVYKDIWSRARRRHSEYTQITGARHLSPEVFNEIHDYLEQHKKEIEKPVDRNNNITKWMKLKTGSDGYENGKRLPFYYYTPTPREFIAIEAKMVIPIDIDEELLKMLKEKENYSVSYLGTSESWIDIKITEI